MASGWQDFFLRQGPIPSGTLVIVPSSASVSDELPLLPPTWALISPFLGHERNCIFPFACTPFALIERPPLPPRNCSHNFLARTSDDSPPPFCHFPIMKKVANSLSCFISSGSFSTVEELSPPLFLWYPVPGPSGTPFRLAFIGRCVRESFLSFLHLGLETELIPPCVFPNGSSPPRKYR